MREGELLDGGVVAGGIQTRAPGTRDARAHRILSDERAFAARWSAREWKSAAPRPRPRAIDRIPE